MKGKQPQIQGRRMLMEERRRCTVMEKHPAPPPHAHGGAPPQTHGYTGAKQSPEVPLSQRPVHRETGATQSPEVLLSQRPVQEETGVKPPQRPVQEEPGVVSTVPTPRSVNRELAPSRLHPQQPQQNQGQSQDGQKVQQHPLGYRQDQFQEGLVLSRPCQHCCSQDQP